MPAVPSSLISSLSLGPARAVLPERAGGLLTALAELPDPRSRRGIRHAAIVVVAAAICAVVAGSRSYAAIGEWVADLPGDAAALLGIDAGRRPSESMIRRLLQSLDPDRLTTVIAAWLATQAGAAPAATTRAIAVDGKTIRGSRTRDTVARTSWQPAIRSPASCWPAPTSTPTNEITRFAPLLDQISDLRGVVVTADALHCQREHVAYLAERGAHWILTVKQNQPSLHHQLAALPSRAVADADRDTARGHGRREIRTVKILSVATGIGFPNAAQALQIRRRRRRLDEPKRFTTETVYAITDLHVHQARLAHLAAWIRGHWFIENKVHWVRDVTYDEDRSQIRTGTGPQIMAALRNAATGALCLAGATNIAAATRHPPPRPRQQPPTGPTRHHLPTLPRPWVGG